MSDTKWCPKCLNLLYPKVDSIHQVLTLTCRNCLTETDTTNPCVYKHDVVKRAKQDSDLTKDLLEDRTLPRKLIVCPNCLVRNKCAFFQAQQGKRTQASMALAYLCSSCEKSFSEKQMLEVNSVA